MVARMKVTSNRTGYPDTLSIRIPFRLAKRGGRKEIHLPDGAPEQHWADGTLIKAIARAFRWKRMLESGEFASIAELAEQEGIAPSYMTRVLRLTLLSPVHVEAILLGNENERTSLAGLMEPFPVEWGCQIWPMQKHSFSPKML
jgi:hypothetical protein